MSKPLKLLLTHTTIPASCISGATYVLDVRNSSSVSQVLRQLADVLNIPEVCPQVWMCRISSGGQRHLPSMSTLPTGWPQGGNDSRGRQSLDKSILNQLELTALAVGSLIEGGDPSRPCPPLLVLDSAEHILGDMQVLGFLQEVGYDLVRCQDLSSAAP